MKLNVLTLALAASAFTVLGANAQVTIEERRDPAVVIEHDEPSVTVEERHRVVPEKRVIERRTTGSADCDTKVIHKEGPTGSKTVKKTRCD